MFQKSCADLIESPDAKNILKTKSSVSSKKKRNSKEIDSSSDEGLIVDRDRLRTLKKFKKKKKGKTKTKRIKKKRKCSCN